MFENVLTTTDDYLMFTNDQLHTGKLCLQLQIYSTHSIMPCSLFSTPSVLLKDSSLCVDVCVLPIVVPRLKIALLDSQRFISLIYLSARKIAR